jgi:repressor LexA
MRPELTPKQHRFLEYLEERIEQTGGTPSLRQAAADLGFSHMAAAQFIKVLEAKGYIRRDGRYSRKIVVLKAGKEQRPTGRQEPGRRVPIIGRIAAGLPLYAQQEYDGAVVVDQELYRGANLFALRVAGDSMREAGILEHDLVICEPRQYAANGEIVAALINNEEATVKRFFLHEDHIELRPANRQHKAQQYGFNEVLVQGKVIGVIRGPERSR